jgi:hypothetical protein
VTASQAPRLIARVHSPASPSSIPVLSFFSFFLFFFFLWFVVMWDRGAPDWGKASPLGDVGKPRPPLSPPLSDQLFVREILPTHGEFFRTSTLSLPLSLSHEPEESSRHLAGLTGPYASRRLHRVIPPPPGVCVWRVVHLVVYHAMDVVVCTVLCCSYCSSSGGVTLLSHTLHVHLHDQENGAWIHGPCRKRVTLTIEGGLG